MQIKIPQNKIEFSLYYDFRWKELRKSFGEPLGSEKDNLEGESHHLMLVEKEKVVGVGRIHFIIKSSTKKAQIRYMAINKKYQRKGYGSVLLLELEKIASENNITSIFLHARERAVSFYIKNNYYKNKKSHLLFGSVQHWLMDKKI